MSTTKVLREQSGIQYQGVQDKSEADPTVSLSNVIVAGVFKRGRFDRPMKITKSNIRSKLGFDPKNKVYQAIEDALNTGAPFIWVQRIAGGSGPQISCADATNSVAINNFKFVDGYKYNNTTMNFAIEINGTWYNTEGGDLEDWLEMNYPLFPANIYASSDGVIHIEQWNSIGQWRIRLKPTAAQLQYSNGYYNPMSEEEDGYMAYYNPSQSFENGVFSFCIVNDRVAS